jgi:HD-like signal output (HDOD) protein
MGKIVLVSLHPDLMDGIAQHCSTALLSQNLAEALLLGVGHAKVGGVVASHWNFPEEFVYPIEFHHLPMLAPAPYRERAHVLHLADCVAHWSEKPGPGLVEPHTMDFFGIKNPLDLEQLAQELQTPAK